jgi:hypothetical protein
MKAVNEQTQFLLEKLRTRMREAAAEGKPLPSPYVALDKARKALGREWDEKTKGLAIEALALWVVSMVAGTLTGTMNEISAVGRFAANSKDETGKKAALELAGSMEFIESVMKMWASAIEFEYVAEQLFEDGEKESKAAEKQVLEKYKPSVN